MDDTELIDKLLTRSEGKDLDFKSVPIVISNPKDKARFIKNLICMANTPREGSAYIVCGVIYNKDGSKEILGVSELDHPDDADLHELVAGNVNPIPRFSYRPVPYSEKRIGILEIDPSFLIGSEAERFYGENAGNGVCLAKFHYFPSILPRKVLTAALSRC